MLDGLFSGVIDFWIKNARLVTGGKGFAYLVYSVMLENDFPHSSLKFLIIVVLY